ncbi:DUF7344 domain-containing protein [Natronosalvus rutilus]|uniref:DUF7344 domain-containing protein n=1 Tax=Natronosalvus rutilus TaxID=2953753 RepID=A0A9E7SWX4_9EURY|nr:hypothetical protein [Natronosalvus rutilus]UTF54476.1 hypothetical protein NGM29_04135 [Natronosalvus rutilus]
MGDPERLSADALYNLLSHHRRRTILELLLAHEQKLTLSDLTNEIAVREYDDEITEISGDKIMDIHISLYHVHIPKLAETNIIEYDQSRGIIDPTENLQKLESQLPPQLLNGKPLRNNRQIIQGTHCGDDSTFASLTI